MAEAEAEAEAVAATGEEATEQVLVFNVEEEEEEEEEEEAAAAAAARSTTDCNCDWKSYRRFIDKIRTRYIPSNLKQIEFSSGQFDILLQTHSHETRLRLMLDCFKLAGYRMETNGRWFEYGYYHSWEQNPPIHFIPGSSFLEMFRHYTCIESSIPVGLTIDDLDLSQHQLTTAVNLLATSMDFQERAWSLLIVNLMICEAIRFDCVSNYIAHVFLDGLPLPPDMLRLVRLKSEDDVWTLYENLKTSFVSQCGEGYNPFIHPLIAEKESMNPPRLLHQYWNGEGIRPLAEVFSVCVNSINGQDSGDFYGAITVCDDYHTQYIYNRESKDSEFIHSGENLLLTGPTTCISPFCPFGFNFVIFGKRIPNWSSVQIEWNPNHTRYEYDKHLSDDFDTDYCSLTLDYIVLSEAVQANVEVAIMEIGGGRSRSIYGTILATSLIFDGREITLFQKKHLEVCAGGHLKLSRSVVVVPWDFSLIIQVKLCDHDGESSFAEGIVEFPAQFFGFLEKKIFGNHSEIQVRVTWT